GRHLADFGIIWRRFWRTWRGYADFGHAMAIARWRVRGENLPIPVCCCSITRFNSSTVMAGRFAWCLCDHAVMASTFVSFVSFVALLGRGEGLIARGCSPLLVAAPASLRSISARLSRTRAYRPMRLSRHEIMMPPFCA